MNVGGKEISSGGTLRTLYYKFFILWYPQSFEKMF